MLWFAFICVALELQILTAVQGQAVELTISRDDQRLDIRCAVPTSTSGNITQLASVVLFRVINDTEVVIATASALPDNNNNVLGATKTSAFSTDISSESFINLAWKVAKKDLNGNYKCELNGFDSNNSHVHLADYKTLALTDTDPALVLEPEVILEGVTRYMTLNCSVEDAASIGMKEIFTVDMKATRSGQGVLLSSVNVFDGQTVMPGSENADVTSKLGNDASYLAMSWTHPQNDLTGRYMCEVTGVDNDNQPVHFVRYTDVSVDQPTTNELISYIQDLEEKHDTVITNMNDLAQKYDEVMKQLSDDQERNADFNGTHVCKDVSRCEDLPYESGRYDAELVLNNTIKVNVICEMDGVGKAWTVFQRRSSGNLSFYQNFESYERGFSSDDGEFWLGLQYIKYLMGDKPHTLRLSLNDSAGSHQIDYPTFAISAGPNYTLHVAGNSDPYGLNYNNGQDFSAYDFGPKKECADASHDASGWWFNNCAYSNLNGLYGEIQGRGMYWHSIYNSTVGSLTSTEMKFRPV